MGLFSSLFGKKKQDEPPYPSWVNDSVKMEAFLSTLQAQVEQKNIPEKFLAGIMTNDYGRNKLLFTAGLMEQHGASYDDQVKAIVSHIEKYWLNTDDKEMWYR